MKRIKLFMLNRRVRKFYITTELACCQWLSNNSAPKFTDVQVMVIYLYGLNLGFKTKTDVYNFAEEHLLKYCRDLPTYKQFCVRINQLAPAFEAFANFNLHSKLKTSKTHLLDSAPIVVAKRSRISQAETASKLCDKGYCASQKMWYYGVKIHILAE